MLTRETSKHIPNPIDHGNSNNSVQRKSKQTPLSPKQILRNFLTYASTALVIRGMTVLITPITMRTLTPEDYGKMALLSSFAQVGMAIMGLGLRQVLALEYFHTHEHKRAHLISTIMEIYCTASIPLAFVALILRKQISYFLFAQAIPAYLVGVSLLFIFTSFFSELCYQVMRFEQQACRLTRLYFTIAVISTGATLFLLWYMRTGYASILYGQFLGAFIATGYGFFSRNIFFSHAIAEPNTNAKSNSKTHHRQQTNNWCIFAQLPSKATFSRYLFLGLPFIPGLLCSWLLSSGDRLMLARYSSLENVGIYSIADAVCQLFTILVLQPWNSSYLPYILKKYSESCAHNNSACDNNLCNSRVCNTQEKLAAQKLIIIERENQKLMWITMAGLLVAIVTGLSIFRPLLLIFLSQEYHDALSYLLLLLVGSVFLYGAHCASTFIQYHKKSGFLAFALALSATLNIILNYILIPHYAIYGCVVATATSYLVYFLITLAYNWHLVRKYNK